MELKVHHLLLLQNLLPNDEQREDGVCPTTALAMTIRKAKRAV